MNEPNTSTVGKKPGKSGQFWRGKGYFRGGRKFHFKKTANTDSSARPKQNSSKAKSSNGTTQNESSNRRSTQISIDHFYDPEPGSYRAWKLYHPMEECSPGSTTLAKTQTMERFIKRHSDMFNTTDIEDSKRFHIDVKYLIGDFEFIEAWSDFNNDLTNNPDHTLNCLSLAMHQAVCELSTNTLKECFWIKNKCKYSITIPESPRFLSQYILEGLENQVTQSGGKMSEVILPIIRARLLNFEPIIQLKDLAANIYGKLVAVKGTVIRVGNIKLLCTCLAFTCNKCNNVQCVQQPEGVYTTPVSCTTSSCMSRTFIPLQSCGFTQTINWQTIKIQEIFTDDVLDGGRVPRTVECELVEELVDMCLPGDVVTVIGIVKINKEDGLKKSSKAPNIFNIYIEAKSVSNSKNYSPSGANARQTIDVEFSTDDYYSIREIHSRPELLKLFVHSMCPSIYGHEMVKAGLLLGLFGGSQGNSARGDSHVLVVGDPGLGKSQMLQACAVVAPRGVYVCGNTSSTSGLSVTLTRESGGNFALEAGALVLADQGCCCIDEFDKMSHQHAVLLEAMEQQVISISKGGVICTLPARTSVLAAANPVCGHYNRAKTVSENLRLGSALLSRFDLVFILQDRPDERLDSLLSEHVMALYSGLKSSCVSECGTSNANTSIQSVSESSFSLSDRLRLHPNENLDLIPPATLRKYVAYAKKYVPNPYLSEGAALILQTFYLQLRKQHHTRDSTPITTRQLESLIRLTQARAKLELREEATTFDAIEVVDLMRWSLVDTFSDSFGVLDFQRSQNGSGMSTKNKAKTFISKLQMIAETEGRSKFTLNEMKEIARKNNLVVGDFFGFVLSLNNQGFLIKKGQHIYQLMSVEF